jgi:branched-chain amino acid transport system ATP-binding protein
MPISASPTSTDETGVESIVLEIRELAVSYGPVLAVRQINVEVNAGEVVAMIGPNGAGKTSTLRAISGLVGYHGQIVFDGVDTRKANIEQLARMGLIHVPEGRHVFPSLNVHENLQVGTTAGAGRSEGFSIDDVYDLFPPLAVLKKRDGWALSGGEQQMVAIGRALVAKPRLLLLDEPSLGLSPLIVESMFDAIRRINEAGMAVLLVEQNVAMALDLAHRAYVLDEGRIVAAGAPAVLASHPEIQRAYLGL